MNSTSHDRSINQGDVKSSSPSPSPFHPRDLVPQRHSALVVAAAGAATALTLQGGQEAQASADLETALGPGGERREEGREFVPRGCHTCRGRQTGTTTSRGKLPLPRQSDATEHTTWPRLLRIASSIAASSVCADARARPSGAWAGCGCGIEEGA